MQKAINRVVAWFSCGAASAVASKLAVVKYGSQCDVVYCDTSKSEHWDNERFFHDVEQWLGREIIVLSSSKYDSIDEVFEQTRYMAGLKGARCTIEMKKVPRFEFQQPDDTHVFGYTVEELKRIAKFEKNNPELNLEWVLRDAGLTKQACLDMLEGAGIEIPAMYKLGYRNNNCIGCVKASSSKYWNKVREDFPGTFARRARQSRELGAKLVYYNPTGKGRGKRIFLDELPASADDGVLENISCGPECGVSEDEDS